MIKPTVGRVVLFRANNNASEQAAIVTYVHSESMVNLCVFSADGGTAGFTSVPLVQDGQTTPPGFYCEWMPYQKAVAAGTQAPTMHATGAR